MAPQPPLGLSYNYHIYASMHISGLDNKNNQVSEQDWEGEKREDSLAVTYHHSVVNWLLSNFFLIRFVLVVIGLSKL